MTRNPDAYYEEPHSSEPCMKCQFCEYDSFHDEKYCGHETPPDNLGPRLLIDRWGHCEQWQLNVSLFPEDVDSQTN